MENCFGLFSLVSGRRRIRLQGGWSSCSSPFLLHSSIGLLSVCHLILLRRMVCLGLRRNLPSDWKRQYLPVDEYLLCLLFEAWELELFYISSGHCSIFILYGNSDSSCAFRMQLWSLWLFYGIKIFLHLNPERPNVPCVECFARVCARLKCPVCGAWAGSSPGMEQCRQGQSP